MVAPYSDALQTHSPSTPTFASKVESAGQLQSPILSPTTTLLLAFAMTIVAPDSAARHTQESLLAAIPACYIGQWQELSFPTALTRAPPVAAALHTQV